MIIELPTIIEFPKRALTILGQFPMEIPGRVLFWEYSKGKLKKKLSGVSLQKNPLNSYKEALHEQYQQKFMQKFPTGRIFLRKKVQAVTSREI